MTRIRLTLVLFVTLIMAGCGYGHGHATLTIGGVGCPSYIDPAVIVRFEDRFTGRPIAVDASGVILRRGSQSELGVFERAQDPYVFSLFADVNHSGTYRLELFVARTLNSPLVEIIYEDVDIYFDACGPITRYIDVLVD